MPPSEPTIFSGPSLILTPNIGRSAKIFDDFICKSFKNWICNIILICPICTWVSPDELDYPNCAIRCFVDLQCCGWWKLPSCSATAIKVGLIGQISIFFVNITLHWWHWWHSSSYHLLGLTIAFRWSVFVLNSLSILCQDRDFLGFMSIPHLICWLLPVDCWHLPSNMFAGVITAD